MPDYTIFGTTPGPTTSATDGQPLNLAHQINITTPCWALGIRYYRANTTITGNITGRLWLSTGPGTGTLVDGTPIAFAAPGDTTDWQTALFTTPVPLEPGSYKPTVRFPDQWPNRPGYWEPGGAGENGRTSGPLTAPNATNAIDGQGSFSTGTATVYPATASATKADYGIDLLVTDTDPEGGVDVADYTVLAGEFGVHEITLVAATESTVTFDTDLDQVEITNHGGTSPVYYTTDGTPATVAGRNTRLLPAGWNTARVRPYTLGSTTVRFVSAGTPKISITRAV